MEGQVEEDVYNCSIPWQRPLCTWATLLTDPNRLFPGSITRVGKGGAISGSPSSLQTLANLCDEFPELVSGWPGGMLLRYLAVHNIARLSATARSWRHIIQDPNVWKLLCALAWPGCRRSEIAQYGGAWRSMYIHRPRPRYDGFYVYKWSTLRHGRDEGRGMKEAGKDLYKPVIITLMYKVFLFQTGGTVLTVTTNLDSTPPERLARHFRRAEIRAATKKVQAKNIHNDCLVSVAGVVLGRWQINGSHLTLKSSHVPEENPRMTPISNSYRMHLQSTATACNDMLSIIEHTTGSDQDRYELAVPSRPYRFLPLDSFPSHLKSLEGWPECYVGEELNVHTEYEYLDWQARRKRW